MTDTPKPRRRWRIAARIMGSTFPLLLLTLAGSACWLWGWQWGSPDFHESWNAEERASLSEFDTYLCRDFSTDNDLADAIREQDLEGWPSSLATAYVTKLYCAPVRAQLHRIAESGRADIPGAPTAMGFDITPAIFAAQMGQFEVLQALIAHGADPNAGVHVGDEEEFGGGDTPMSPLLCGYRDKRIPWAERQKVAEFLLAHGADLNRHGHVIGMSCTVAHVRGESEPWIWAVTNGKKVSGAELINVLTLGELSLPMIKAMLHNSPGAANDNSATATPLQALAAKIRDAEAEELPALEQVLDLLLAHGADPTLRPAPKEEHMHPEHRLPLDILLSKNDFATCGMDGSGCEGEGDSALTIWQRMCEKLQK